VVERGFHEYQQQITALLKREAQGKSLAEKAAAVRAMCELHGEIVTTGDIRPATCSRSIAAGCGAA